MLELIFYRKSEPCLRHVLDTGHISIGRDPDNTIQLIDDDVSRKHCVIEFRDENYFLIDHSSNGTFLNTNLVQESKINIGDKIDLGSWTIEVLIPDNLSQKTTVACTRSKTAVLGFDAKKKTISSQRIYLTIYSPLEQGRVATITDVETVIGSMETGQVIIKDDFVSKNHCSLLQKEDGVLLTDLGSTNGTFVNGSKITQMVLPAEGSFRIGKTDIGFKIDKEIEKLIPIEEESLGKMFGKSKTMRETFFLIKKAAPSDATILVTGKTGTGKELVARSIHDLSSRSKKVFISVNCGALPSSIIESQLFGHEKGSFTGANEKMIGLIEQANGGTLFLDEIGEMPVELQTRLLHVLENKKIKRLGGRVEIDVDFRLVAATNKDLQQLVSENKFREDLFYRLYVVPINLRPLREREKDVLILAKKFVKDFSPKQKELKLNEEAIKKLLHHFWPGNVRELKNVIQRAVVMSDRTGVKSDDISFPPIAEENKKNLNLEDKEYESIVKALKEARGNQSKAAKKLGIARTTLAYKVSRYQIDINKL